MLQLPVLFGSEVLVPLDDVAGDLGVNLPVIGGLEAFIVEYVAAMVSPSLDEFAEDEDDEAQNKKEIIHTNIIHRRIHAYIYANFV